MMQIDYQYMRPKKAQALKRWQEADVDVCEHPSLWQGCNATVLPLRPDAALLFGKGGVVDQDGQYIPLSSIPGRVEGAYPVSSPEYRDEKIVYCGYLVNHWGHFLIEGVTRLWYYLENDPTVDKYVFFLNENETREIRGNYRMFLELLGIWEHLEIISRPTTYREVIIPDRGLHCRQSYAPKLLQVFDRVAEHVVPKPEWETPEKIFFSRSQFKKGLQFEFGLECMDDFFGKNGYTVVYPEKVPLDQMIHCIRSCKTVASLSGTLPHNMLFARPGQHIEIIERFVLNNDNQTDVNRMRQLHVTYVDGVFPIYPVEFVGPLIMGYTDCMQRFAADRGYQPPDGRYQSKAHYKRCFVNYMKAYQDLNGYNWYMLDWHTAFADTLLEGYRAGHAIFGDYLDKKRPYRWHHYFELHYFKQWLKRILKKA